MGNPASLSQISRYSQRALLLVTSRLQLPASAHFSIPTQPSPSVHTVLFHTTSLHHGNCSNSCIAQAPSTRKTPHCVISDPLRFSHQEKVRNASEFLREMFSMIKKREQEQVGEVLDRAQPWHLRRKKGKERRWSVGRASRHVAALRRSWASRYGGWEQRSALEESCRRQEWPSYSPCCVHSLVGQPREVVALAWTL